MLPEVVLISAAAAFGGLIVGGLSSAFVVTRRMRRRVEEVSDEVVRMQQIAEDKLLEDDPNLADLLRNLNTAVEQAYRAVDALENQSRLNRTKSEGGREVIASSRHILRMMEDMGAEVPEAAYEKTRTIEAEPVEKEQPTLT